jgi:hypothetical protein
MSVPHTGNLEARIKGQNLVHVLPHPGLLPKERVKRPPSRGKITRRDWQCA